MSKSINENSTYLFQSKVCEIADEREEIDCGQGQRHERGVKIFTDNVIDREEYNEEVAD